MSTVSSQPYPHEYVSVAQKRDMAEEYNLRKMKANSLDSHTANTYDRLW